MKKAVLYARVSSQLQKEENTIESQINELKKQIVDDGNVLVKEYIDNGYSGARIDRPSLEQMRSDLRTNLFDTIYFLNTDRIARNIVHQTIIISDILKHNKQLIINGKDYVYNPENNFTLTILGAVAELERTKIIERTTRGRMHKLRKGQIIGQGGDMFGYTYVKKTRLSPPLLKINEEEAKTVRLIFELYANKKYGIYQITRTLEEKSIKTKRGLSMWRASQIRYMLKKEAYAGTKYFNTMYHLKESTNKIRSVRYGSIKHRPRSEWIGIKIPAIISKELFDKVQERIRINNEKYRQPMKHQLLQGLVNCGECGHAYNSYRRYVGKWLKIGIRRIYHKTAYACTWRLQERMHSFKTIKHCRNPEVITHILEKRVFEMIQESMIDPNILKRHMEFFREDYRADQKKFELRLSRTEKQEKMISTQKKSLIDQYARGKISQEEYVDGNISLDKELHELKIKKAELIKSVPLLHKKEVVDLSIRQFCENAKIHLERSADFASKRKFLLEHVEKIIYQKYNISILGSIPIKLKAYEDAEQTSEASKIEFRIESEIDRSTLHRGVRLKFAEDGRLKEYGSSGRFKIISNSPLKRVRLPVGPMGPRVRKNLSPKLN